MKNTHMSHCILKQSVPPAQGFLMDVADSVEDFCYWLKDSCRSATKNSGKGMSVSVYRTGNVRVNHANDDDDDSDDMI